MEEVEGEEIEERVFVVTGGNRGIGLATVELLCNRDVGTDVVYLTARNDSFGKYAVADLQAKGLEPEFFILDILERKAIEEFRDHLVQKHGGFDVLINNAGVSKGTNATQAQINVENNFGGTLLVCEILMPILKNNGRVVNLSSRAALRAFVGLSPEMKANFLNVTLDIEGLKALMERYVTSLQLNSVKKEGFPPALGYGMSKLAVTVMGMIQQREYDAEEPSPGIVISSCCPGSVQTDMTLFKGNITPEEAAHQTVMLALLPPEYDGPRGAFFEQEKVIPFTEENLWNCKWAAGVTGIK